MINDIKIFHKIIKLISQLSMFYFVGLSVCLFIILLPINATFNFYNEFDNQRIYQLLLIIYCLTFFLLDSSIRKKVIKLFYNFSFKVRYLLLSLLILSIISSFVSPLKNYAFLELSLYSSLFLLSLIIGALVQNNFKFIHSILLIVFIISSILYQTAFFSGYLASFIEKIPLQWPEPFIGFSNIRFFNQYHLWLYFLISLPLLIYPQLNSTLRTILKIIAIGWAILLFISGSRGAIAAIFLTLPICAIIFKKQAYSFIKLNSWILLSGFLSSIVLFKFLPTLLSDNTNLGWRTVAQIADNSPRLYLWKLSLNYIVTHPFLGIGLMHYAYYPNSVAMHPHNSLLQWTAELGIPSVLILIMLIMWGLLVWIKRFYSNSLTSRFNNTEQQLWIVLFCTMIANLMYSLVDGVIVMPVSQVLMALIMGWMFGVYFYFSDTIEIIVDVKRNISLLLVVGITLITLMYTVMPSLMQRLDKLNNISEIIETDLMYPRFWQDGKIPNEVDK